MLGSFEPVARLVVAVLFNGLWQGILIAGAVWLILRAFPRVNASTRYAAWSLALLAVMIVPIVTTLPRVSNAAPVRATAAIPYRASTTVGVSHHQPLPSRQAGSPAQIVAAPSVSLPAPAHFSVPGAPTVIVFGLWSLAALLILLRLVVALARLEKLKHDALPLSVEYRDAMHRWLGASKGSRDVRICVSDAIDVPVAVGLFDSMILLPKSLLDKLETQEVDQISLHELAHLRRADDWTNGVQRFAQALLFFNPAIAFIARQMDLEREVACDDWVLSLTGDVRPYAFCLTKMAEVTAWPHRAMAAPGVFITRKSISIRIERLLAVRRAIGSALAPGASAAVLGVVLAIVLFVQMVTPSIAYTGSQIVATTQPSQPTAKIVAHKAAAPKASAPKSAAVTAAPSKRSVAFVGAATTPVQPPVPLAAPKYGAADAAGKASVAKAAMASASTIISAVASSLPRTIADAMAGCTGCDFHGANLAGHNFSHSSLTGADFHGANLRGANFKGAHLTGDDFHGADLRDASFVGAGMEGCDLRGAQVAGADFTGAVLTGCDLDLQALSAAQTAIMIRQCTGCDFHGANLRDRDLRGIQVEGANLSYADLRGADLRGAVLTGVDLSYAKLDGAKLDGAQLMGCELRGVDLRNVDLSRVTMTGTSMSGAIMK